MHEKHQLTGATSDRVLHLVARGTNEELLTHVSRPEEFAEHRRETASERRGEDKIYVSEAERANTEARKRISKAFKKLERDKAEAVERCRVHGAEEAEALPGPR